MSFRDRVLSVFPPPSFLATPTLGIDLSQGKAKCVLLEMSGREAALDSYMEVPLPAGAVEGGDVSEPEKVVETLRTLRLKTGIRYANAALSERKAYLYQTVVPGEAGDVRFAIEADLETHVPVPPADVVFDFEIIRRTDTGTLVTVTAYPKKFVDAYVRMFGNAGLTLRALEVESHSLARAALSGPDLSTAVMVVDLGENATRIAIAENGVVSFTATVEMGGASFTAAVMKLFNLSAAEAEKMKIEKGFLMHSSNKELVEALMSSVSVIKEEIAKHLAYWNSLDDGIPRKKVEKAVLCGGNANLRGFPEYLEGALGIPVSLANVWGRAFSLDAYVPPMPFAESLEYATAIGLAERDVVEISW